MPPTTISATKEGKMIDLDAARMRPVRLSGDRMMPDDKPKPNRCYGCNWVEAPPGDTAPFYCGGCAEWDEHSMAGADDDDDQDEGDGE